jgi:hypothetical protein
MLATSERRFSSVPQEENAETITELISAFLDNLNPKQDRQTINSINEDLQKLSKVQGEKLRDEEMILQGLWY